MLVLPLAFAGPAFPKTASCPIDGGTGHATGKIRKDMQAVLDRMNFHGRVVVCGLIFGYTTHDPNLVGFGQLIIKRLRVEGSLIMDYIPKFMDAGQKLGMWKMTGKLKSRETIVKGLEKAPEAINMLFHGDNTGKLIVEL